MTPWRKISSVFLFLLLNSALFAQNTQTSPSAALIDVQAEHLVSEPVSGNWVSYNGDYTGRRYSSLREINVSNVSELRAQWTFHVQNSDRLEVTPVVVDG